ncbi:GTP-binding protein [gamma proteobacterium HdN1]|nr:GTP-binding protein [gamma proteobacterium HdN1]
MKAAVALVGRPNVGKSTLFNRLTKTRDAIVADMPGLTRDRKYGEARVGAHAFLVIDTGGITGEEEGIDSLMAEQSMLAIEEADLVFFIVDAKAGLTAGDEVLAQRLRVREKPLYVVVNKIDGQDSDEALAEFSRLGLGDPFFISASHGRGVTQMIDDVFGAVGEDAILPEPTPEDTGIRIAVVGRPNVGKSTLINRMLGEERVVVFDMPGTTRDSIYIPYERRGQKYTLIDTAGVRKRGRVDEAVEKFSVIKTLQAIEDAHVVILVLDAREGIVDQDLHLLGFVLETGRSLLIALNKWDGMDDYQKSRVKVEIDRRMEFVSFAKIHFISALHGTGVGDLYGSVERAYQSAFRRLSTPALTRILEDAIADYQPPLVGGRRIKLRYAHMGGVNPPRIVIHGNQTDSVPGSYRRYLENTFHRLMKLEGTPLQVEFKTSENPFAGRPQELSARQTAKKKRLMTHVKKAEYKRKQKTRK